MPRKVPAKHPISNNESELSGMQAATLKNFCLCQKLLIPLGLFAISS